MDVEVELDSLRGVPIDWNEDNIIDSLPTPSPLDSPNASLHEVNLTIVLSLSLLTYCYILFSYVYFLRYTILYCYQIHIFLFVNIFFVSAGIAATRP